MKHHLVNKFMGLEFCYEFLLAKQTLLKQGKYGVDAIVCHGSVNQIIIVRKLALRTVRMHKVDPIVSRRIRKNQSLEP